MKQEVDTNYEVFIWGKEGRVLHHGPYKDKVKAYEGLYDEVKKTRTHYFGKAVSCGVRMVTIIHNLFALDEFNKLYESIAHHRKELDKLEKSTEYISKYDDNGRKV